MQRLLACMLVLEGCTATRPAKRPDPEPPDTSIDSAAPPDTTDTAVPLDCHAWEPVSVEGWTRSYDITYLGEVGTETHTGEGLATFAGEPAYAVRQVLVTALHSHDVRHYSQCDLSVLGLFEVGFAGTRSDGWLGVPEETGIYTPPWRTLLDADELGITGTTWLWAHEVVLTDGQARTAHIPATGTFVDQSFEGLTVPAGEFPTAWHLSGTYTRDRRTVQAYGVVEGVVNGTTHSWHAAGVGLLKEEVVEEGVVIYSRELTSYSGLR